MKKSKLLCVVALSVFVGSPVMSSESRKNEGGETPLELKEISEQQGAGSTESAVDGGPVISEVDDRDPAKRSLRESAKKRAGNARQNLLKCWNNLADWVVDWYDSLTWRGYTKF